MTHYLHHLSVRPVTTLRHAVSTPINGDAAMVLGNIDAGGSKLRLAVLAWSALMATILVLASVLQAVATSALVEPEGAAFPAAHLSAATAAVADGDDARALFLRNLPTETLGPTPVSCSMPATDGNACIS
jgi:hypothetical protein